MTALTTLTFLGTRRRPRRESASTPMSGEFRAYGGMFPVSSPVSVRPVADQLSRSRSRAA